MTKLRVLRLFGNPLEFLPDILPLQKVRHLSLANIRVVADDQLRSVNVQMEVIITLFLNFELFLLSGCLMKLKNSPFFVSFWLNCRRRIILTLLHLGIN